MLWRFHRSIVATSRAAKKYLIGIVKHHNTNAAKVKELVDIVIAKGGIAFSSKKMEEFRDKALDILFTFPDNTSRQALLELVNYTINRKK